MALYETIFIIHPEHGGQVKEYLDAYRKTIEGLGGTVRQVDEWGLRDLAYSIDKQTKGYYSLIQYSSTVRAVEEVERNMKLSEGVLRYLTVRLEEGADVAPRPKAKEVAEQPKAGSQEELAKTDTQP